MPNRSLENIGPERFVGALFRELRLEGLEPEVSVIEDAYRSRAVLIPLGDQGVLEPVRISATVRPHEIVLEAERFRILTRGVDPFKVLEAAFPPFPRLSAGAVLNRRTFEVLIRKRVVEGLSVLVEETGLGGGIRSADDVVKTMVDGVLFAMDSLGLETRGLGWTSFDFEPPSRRAPGGLGMTCFLCLFGASILAGLIMLHQNSAVD
ncbi:MAG: hypothetical protein HYY44_03125 [Deltaproteobacteria bacterium]|nr:hypothetical protein [Deltaproteobacteria bacterium]